MRQTTGTLSALIVATLLHPAPVSAQQPQGQAPQVSAAAAVPRVIRIAGTLSPVDGMPLAAVETVTIRIYAAEHDVTPLWHESQTVTPEANGRYTVLIGATREEGVPLEVFRSGEARWIGVTLDRTGEGEAPRIRLVSVPYALRAQDAETLGGHPASAYVRTRDGASRENGTASDVPETVLPGTLNMLAKYTTGTEVGNSALFENAGRVGLNTATPRDAMHVQFTNTAGSMAGYAVQNLGNTATSYSGMLFFDHNGVLGQFQGFNNVTHEYRINNIARNGASQFDGTINFMTGSVSRLFVAANGNVGIGATSPSQRLHVAGSIDHSGDIRRDNLPILQAQTGGADNNLVIGARGPQMSNLVGVDNTLVGTYAGRDLTTGASHVVVGSGALISLNGGVYNTVIGTHAAAQKPSGSQNIYIGPFVGDDPANTEDFTIRIGNPAMVNRAFIGGVRSITTGAANAVTVLIDGNGQLGTVNSSRRYKEDIQDMGDASSGLMKLRPVTFRYTQAYADGSRPVDYGLIAEEVKEVYPDLVAHLANGDVETVQYHKINAMLLNEVQKQHQQLRDQQRRLEAQRQEIDTLLLRLAALERAVAGGR